MFYTSPSPSLCRPQGTAEPLMWELPEGKDQALILSQEQAHSQLSHCQSLRAPAPLHPLGILCIWASLFWIIIMSPSKIFIKLLHTYCSGHPHLFLLSWHMCNFHSIFLKLLDMILCHLHTSSGIAFKTPRTQNGSPAFVIAVAMTLGFGAGNLGSGTYRMAASSKYNPEQSELTYNLEAYHR